MISIITAVYNGLPMNKLFVRSLKRYTSGEFELIVIDNGSTDGSKEFFKSEGAKVIENKANYSYPYCQNQGIEAASYKTYAFLNNDIIVAPEWDRKLLHIMKTHELDVITPCGIERIETREASLQIRRRWKLIKNPISFLFGINELTLNLMFRLMYKNWEKFSSARYDQFHAEILEGFVGNSVIMSEQGIQKAGMWDERIQAADFDLYMRVKKRSLEHNDIKPVHIALGVFHHHYIRITSKSKPPKFADITNLISLEKKWGDQLDFYLKDNTNF